MCLVKISIICLQQFRRNLYFGIMMQNKQTAKNMVSLAIQGALGLLEASMLKYKL